jgi:hypothetical protein
MTTEVTTVSLDLPVSLKAAVEKMATAEKLGAMQSADAFFAERKGRGDKAAAIRLLSRVGGEPPREGDQLPE